MPTGTLSNGGTGFRRRLPDGVQVPFAAWRGDVQAGGGEGFGGSPGTFGFDDSLIECERADAAGQVPQDSNGPLCGADRVTVRSEQPQAVDRGGTGFGRILGRLPEFSPAG
jgi:hypothetical protein